MDELVDLSVRIVEEKPALPKDIGAHELLQMVYRGEISVTPQQMQAAKESIAYEKPKAKEPSGGSFYEMLENAIERRQQERPKLIDVTPVPTVPASALKRPFARRRV